MMQISLSTNGRPTIEYENEPDSFLSAICYSLMTLVIMYVWKQYSAVLLAVVGEMLDHDENILREGVIIFTQRDR